MNAKQPMSTWLLAIAIAFGLGMIAGSFIFRSRPAPEQARSLSPSPAPSIAPVARKAEAPDQSPTVAREWQPPAEPVYVSRLEGLSKVNRLLSAKFHVPMMVGYDLNPDFVALYGLSESEVQALRNEIQAAYKQLAELGASHATFKADPKGGITVSIPAFPTEGGAVYDHFLATIRSVLGEERYGFSNSISPFDSTESSAFDMFGLSMTEIHVKTMRDQDGNPSSTGSITMNPSIGGMIKTVVTDPILLKSQYPLIYQKLVESGAIPKRE